MKFTEHVPVPTPPFKSKNMLKSFRWGNILVSNNFVQKRRKKSPKNKRTQEGAVGWGDFPLHLPPSLATSLVIDNHTSHAKPIILIMSVCAGIKFYTGMHGFSNLPCYLHKKLWCPFHTYVQPVMDIVFVYTVDGKEKNGYSFAGWEEMNGKGRALKESLLLRCQVVPGHTPKPALLQSPVAPPPSLWSISSGLLGWNNPWCQLRRETRRVVLWCPSMQINALLIFAFLFVCL